MKNRMLMAALAISTLLSPLAQAQDQGLGDMMFTAGTVMTDESGQEWAWLQWMATDSALLQSRPMDIHWKAGDATSGNAFALKGRAMQITDPRTIALLLARGETLGENLENLEGAVDSLYAGAEPLESLSLAEKLAALISGSQSDPELYNNLVFMGRAHPAVSMAIGQGFACQIPNVGYSTFEVRDAATAEVIGRVILAAGSPEVLPAPGPIVRVPETTPMGNLNIRLRWDVPNDLKRLSLLQFGYNLYRVTQHSANKWWGPSGAPPSTAELVEYADRYASAKKINRMPILIDAALTTSNTWYAVDDNDGQSPGGTPFVDGVEYYYYVTALDLLGRDGDLSDPFLTFPCDRFAPSVPHGITTRTISEYVGGVRDQYVEVSWDHDANDDDTARYYVYRHTSLSNMQVNATNTLANRISGALVPAPTATRMVYEDHTLSSNDWSVTYWYTVRAEDNARCANNLSGNSAPAYGLLRDWQGPSAATNVVVTIQSEVLSTSVLENYVPGLEEPWNVELKCLRNTDGEVVEWVEFAWYQGGYRGEGSEPAATSAGRFYFAEGSSFHSKAYAFDPALEYITVFCRVGSTSGKVSAWAHNSLTIPSTKFPAKGVLFEGKSVLVQGPVTADNPGPHYYGKPGDPITYVKIEISATLDAETVRVYRRVDNGRRTLIHQGEMDEVDGVAIEDHLGGMANASIICYYYQLFDEHGNASPMVKFRCYTAEARATLPIPILNPIDPIGMATYAPGMKLKWFCTTPGVERFEVALGITDGSLPSTFGTSDYVLQDGAPNIMEAVIEGETNTFNFGFYRTGRIGTVFGNAGSPAFELDGSVALNRDYVVMVRAIDTVGKPGQWSNAEAFQWNTVPTAGPRVPWPARKLPIVQDDVFHEGLDAYFLMDPTAWNPIPQNAAVGIKIGEIPPTIDDSSGGSTSVSFERFVDYSGSGNEKAKLAAYRFNIEYDLENFLYENVGTDRDPALPDESVFPCVLYRYQLTNDLYQTVSGDVAQASPLMEELAVGSNGGVTTLYDAFIYITRPQDSTEPWGIFLLDTQPVVRGATYQYLLMRFDEETHELDRTIPAGTVTIPQP